MEHIGTLPRFFARMGELFIYLMSHWRRFVEDNGTENRSRWPAHPAWAPASAGEKQIAKAQRVVSPGLVMPGNGSPMPGSEDEALALHHEAHTAHILRLLYHAYYPQSVLPACRRRL